MVNVETVTDAIRPTSLRTLSGGIVAGTIVGLVGMLLSPVGYPWSFAVWAAITAISGTLLSKQPTSKDAVSRGLYVVSLGVLLLPIRMTIVPMLTGGVNDAVYSLGFLFLTVIGVIVAVVCAGVGYLLSTGR